MCSHINQICCCSGNKWNWSNQSIKFFRQYVADPIHVKGKGFSFIKWLSCKFSTMDFYRKVQKRGLESSSFSFLSSRSSGQISLYLFSNSSLLKVYRSSINLKILENIQAFHMSHFFLWRSHFFSQLYKIKFAITGAGSDPLGIPINWKHILPKAKSGLSSK